MHQHAKFRQNRSIGCGDIAILQIFKMAATEYWIFEIVNFYLLTVSGGPRRITVQNLVKIGRSIT